MNKKNEMNIFKDEEFVNKWDEYVQETSSGKDAWEIMKYKLVQLSFPIKKGTRLSEAYRKVTLRGEDPQNIQEATGLELINPELLKIWLHSTSVGRIPVIYTPQREDFISIVQALAHYNEPEYIPPSMGACLIRGYNNWDRVNILREKWLAENSSGFLADSLFYSSLKERKHLYQDKFIILSRGEYSSIKNDQIGLTYNEWLNISEVIRLEHESAHYALGRLLPKSPGAIMEEIIADYAGMVLATGKYNPIWLLLFLGLENYPSYRPGGRLENYCTGYSQESEEYKLLLKQVYNAVYVLEFLNIELSKKIKLGKLSDVFQYLGSINLEDFSTLSF